jgi:predicted dehydrogenase
MKRDSLLTVPGATHLAICVGLSFLTLGTGCADATASLLISFELGTLDLDQRVESFEDAACASAASESCAVLSAVADFPFTEGIGPTSDDGETPRLPPRFASMVTVQSLTRDVDVGDWFEKLQGTHGKARGDTLSFQRTPLAGMLPEGIDPELLTSARIESAQLVHSDNASVDLPAFDIVVGIDDDLADDLADDITENDAADDDVDDDAVIVEDDGVVDEDDAESAAAADDGEAWLVSRSSAFDDDGVATLEFGNGALEKLSWALQHEGGYVQVGGTDGVLPQLTAAPGAQDTLLRPSGDLTVRLDLTLRVHISRLQGAFSDDL